MLFPDGGNVFTTTWLTLRKSTATREIHNYVWDLLPICVGHCALLKIAGLFFCLSLCPPLTPSSPLLVSPPGCLHGLQSRSYCQDFANQAVEVGAAIARARAALPQGCPLFLLGESVGGLNVLQHQISVAGSVDEDTTAATDKMVDGVILCGALLEVAPGVLPPKVCLCASSWNLSESGFSVSPETVVPLLPSWLQACGWVADRLGALFGCSLAKRADRRTAPFTAACARLMALDLRCVARTKPIWPHPMNTHPIAPTSNPSIVQPA